MRQRLRQIFPSFPNSFVLKFIGTDGNSTEHPKYGKHQLSTIQLRNAPGDFKNKLYSNIIECLKTEIEFVRDGGYGGVDQPIIQSPYVKMLFDHKVEGAHTLNRFIKYPELEEAVDELEKEFKSVLKKHMGNTSKIDSKMPYKQQYMLEVIIERVKGWEDSV